MSSSVGKEPETRQTDTLLIGFLSTFIFVLLVAIVFLVVRKRRQKRSGPNGDLPGVFPSEKNVSILEQLFNKFNDQKSISQKGFNINVATLIFYRSYYTELSLN